MLELIEKNYKLNEKEQWFFSVFMKDYEKELTKHLEIIELLIKFKLDISSVIAYIIVSLKLECEINEDVTFICESLKVMAETTYDYDACDEETLRRMLIAISKDLRVLIIKLCLILKEISKFKMPITSSQKSFLHQVEDIFAPLAERLGLNALKSELEDNCLRCLNPSVYDYLYKNSLLLREENNKQLEISRKKIESFLEELNISATIASRQKHFSSINKKMQNQNIPLAKIYDLVAMRVLVNNIEECYSVLGKIHSIYKPIPGRFKDYIASPKRNGYQSLHTTIVAENQRPLEIQIRTYDMHRYAEYGIAAHWLYKEKKSKQSELDKKMTWIREVMENSAELSNEEFIKTLKTNLYRGVIFVQTPKGKVMEFPEGSNIIDFAYAIHSDVGNRCIGAKVNSKIVPLTTRLNNGDIVEILTSNSSKGPSRDWLKSVKTVSARNKIHAFFKKELKEENIRIGKSIIEQGLKNKNVAPSKVLNNKFLKPIFIKYSFNNEDEMYSAVGYGNFPSNQIVNRLIQDYIREENSNKPISNSNILVKKNKDGVLIDGDSGMLIRYAGCCEPNAGDGIVGYISRGRGVTIHKCDCYNLKYLEPERLINASWDVEVKQNTINSSLIIEYEKNSNVNGNVAKILFINNVNLIKLDTRELADKFVLYLTISATSVDVIDKVISEIKNIKNIKKIIEDGRKTL